MLDVIEQPQIDQCKMENQKPNIRQKSLSLIDMSSAFLVFGFGLSLAFTVFLVELLFGCLQKNKKNNKDLPPMANQRHILAIEATPPAKAPSANNDDELPNTDSVIKTIEDNIKQQSSSVAAAALVSTKRIEQEEKLDAITLAPLSAHHDGKQQASSSVVNTKKSKQLEQAANIVSPAALNQVKSSTPVKNTLNKQQVLVVIVEPSKKKHQKSEGNNKVVAKSVNAVNDTAVAEVPATLLQEERKNNRKK